MLEVERNMDQSNKKDNNKWHNYMCLTANITIGCSFLCMVIFLASYVPISLNNQTYVVGTCTIVKGQVVFDGDSYNAYFGITAMPNITVYLFIDSYSNETDAIMASNRDIGKSISPCYYKDRGNIIVLSLPNTLGPFVAGFVFLGLAILFTLITFIIIWFKFELRAKCFHCMICCKFCLGKKQNYKPFQDQTELL